MDFKFDNCTLICNLEYPCSKNIFEKLHTWGMENLAILEGWPLMGGISYAAIHSFLSKIVAL